MLRHIHNHRIFKGYLDLHEIYKNNEYAYVVNVVNVVKLKVMVIMTNCVE